MRLKVVGVFLSPCSITSHSQSIPPGVLSQRHVCFAHQDLVKAIYQVDDAELGAAGHGVKNHVFPRNRRLRRDGGVVELVEDVDDPPSAGSFFHAERRAGMRGHTLTDVAGLTATFEEDVDRFDLITGKWPLARHTVRRARHEVDLVPNSTIRWKDGWNLDRGGLDELSHERSVWAAYRAARAFFGSAPFGRVRASAVESDAWVSTAVMDAAFSATIMHTCSISPFFKSRRKCFHKRPDSRVISAASHGGRVTPTCHAQGGSSALFSTRTEITSDSVSSGPATVHEVVAVYDDRGDELDVERLPQLTERTHARLRQKTRGAGAQHRQQDAERVVRSRRLLPSGSSRSTTRGGGGSSTALCPGLP
ncbi:hypothetical protein PF005_g21867 [Phytophthora fragariae]|uniref:Uncharacterized protein n=1 Tax=Phytophthora fragariae TaxID=53985 RepID=A0A6A3WK63_9STRA|nr:hypothetical protein PF009_g20918 [Phytophthora fragariae]KAE9022657.1 hypothetical protein PF011_g4360 [Phytophthora fragariae]KAE9078791.1 hypothetical protein PF010_g23006 [Phytophthora fragariae]KAE9183988.1 hypothetical protein PF005_g21867 [Phytophthora fragariae]